MTGGLSTGSKAGLGVGVAIGIVLLGGLVIAAVRWQRVRRRQRTGAVCLGKETSFLLIHVMPGSKD